VFVISQANKSSFGGKKKKGAAYLQASGDLFSIVDDCCILIRTYFNSIKNNFITSLILNAKSESYIGF
jgi:hypothetical protein